MVDQLNKSSLLQVKQVSLLASLGANYLLQDISFDLHKGDRLVIIGASGAGKSTLLRLLNRLQNPSQGKLFFQSQEYSQINSIDLRQHIVLVPQEPKLLGMTVKETLVYPLVLQKLSKPEIARKISTWIDKLRIPETWLERNELQLSVGQRQLVVIARALVMEPQILLLDEPTSALDLGTANHVVNILQEIADAQNMAIMMVNHHLDLAQQFATRVLYLESGILLQDQREPQVNWQEIKAKLKQIETKIAQEWDET